MWDGFNTRKFPRINLDCQISLHLSSRKLPIVTTTENIGLGGVCVIQDQSLDRFSLCKIRLDLDKENLPIECTGKIVWIIPRREPAAKNKCYDTGIEFVDLNDSQKERIRSFIQSSLPKGFQDIV